MAFVTGGLVSGDRVDCFTDSAPPRLVGNLLRRAGLDAAAALRSGQLRVVPADNSYLADMRFDPDHMISVLSAAVDNALQGGFPGYRVTGDMTWAARQRRGAERLLEYETRVNEVFAARPVAALCQYSRRAFSTADMAAAMSAHPCEASSPGVHVLVLGEGPRLSLVGEADAFSAGALEQVLTSIAHPGSRLQLELGGLRFVDTAIGRLLVGLGQKVTPGGTVSIHHAPVTLKKIFDIGWGQTPPGLELC